MRGIINGLRMLLAESLLRLATRLAPWDTEEGRTLQMHIYSYSVDVVEQHETRMKNKS
jgi:hypothetical protein